MKIYVGNLPKDISDEQFKELAGPYGKIAAANVARERGGESKGFGFIEYADAAAGNAAIAGLNGTDVGGQRLKASEARSQSSGSFPRGRRY